VRENPKKEQEPMTEKNQETFDQWAVVEVFGHKRVAGRVTEATIGGQSFVRVDVPGTDNVLAFTQFYGQGSIYCLTPTTEEIAREVARYSSIEPITPFELRALRAPVANEGDDKIPF
jgi:hypothetical protein